MSGPSPRSPGRDRLAGRAAALTLPGAVASFAKMLCSPLLSGLGAGARLGGLLGLLVLAAGIAAGAAPPTPLEAALRDLQADDLLVADAAVDQLVACGPVAVPALLPLLADERRDVRAGAIRALGLIGDPRAGEPVLGVLRSCLEGRDPDTFEDRYVRILAIQALGRLREQKARPALGEVVRGGDPFERVHAAVSLFLLREELGYDLLRRSLADTSLAIRNIAVEGLGEGRTEVARDLILAATEDESWVVRDTAYRALGSWREDEQVRAALRKGAEDPSRFVRETVAELQSLEGTVP
jgi:HEAT repeat protein